MYVSRYKQPLVAATLVAVVLSTAPADPTNFVFTKIVDDTMPLPISTGGTGDNF